MAKLLQITVEDREKVLFEGMAKSVSSVNDKGKFDVLVDHANFISLLAGPLVIQKQDGTKEEINVDNGVIKVVANDVRIYLGIKR